MNIYKNPKNLIEVYKALLGEEHFFVDLYEKRLTFFTGVITANISGIAWIYAHFPIDYVFLLIANVALVFVSSIAQEAARRAADRITRTITERAKIEQAIGLTRKPETELTLDGAYWIDEPIIATKHLESRQKFLSSQEFHDDNMKSNSNGFLAITLRYYAIAYWAGWIQIGLSAIVLAGKGL